MGSGLCSSDNLQKFDLSPPSQQPHLPWVPSNIQYYTPPISFHLTSTNPTSLTQAHLLPGAPGSAHHPHTAPIRGITSKCQPQLCSALGTVDPEASKLGPSLQEPHLGHNPGDSITAESPAFWWLSQACDQVQLDP